MAKLLDYPEQICFECGEKYGRVPKWPVGCWYGKCDICGKEGTLTAPRDFGYPKIPGYSKPIRQLEF